MTDMLPSPLRGEGLGGEGKTAAMILEGIVTTISQETGEVNIAPMGPHVDDAMERFVLRPFPTSQTYKNLKSHGEGVLHVTDDVLLLAKAAVGTVKPQPAMLPACKVHGFVLADACRYFEFQVTLIDETEPRVRIEAETLHVVHVRDFFGFNRAKHAVVEAAILATRTAFLPRAEIESEFKRLAVLVEKTGGPREKEAFAFLQRHVGY